MANRFVLDALRYVRNVSGNATREHFVTDFEPVGESLWNEIYNDSPPLVAIDNVGKIYLTEEGARVLLIAS